MDVRVRECKRCGTTFMQPRVPGRPRQLCSEACRRAAAATSRHLYILRHFAGQLDGLQAA